MAVWLQVTDRMRGLGPRSRLNAGPVLDVKRRCGGRRGLRYHISVKPLPFTVSNKSSAE